MAKLPTPNQNKATADAIADAIADALRRGKTPIADSQELGLAGVSVFAAVHDRMALKLIEACQLHLNKLEGTSLETEVEMREFAAHL